MNVFRHIARHRHAIWITIGLAAALSLHTQAKSADEVVLTIDEPYEQVRRQSRSTLPPIEPGADWYGVLTRPARLRFADPQYGFVTPSAKFFTVGYSSKGTVKSITLSPQVETLTLNETMAVVLDLQDQLRRKGWRPIRISHHPPLSDTPAMRMQLRNNEAPQSFWLAGEKYQAYLDVRRFRHTARPNDERYLITLQISGPPLTGE